MPLMPLKLQSQRLLSQSLTNLMTASWRVATTARILSTVRVRKRKRFLLKKAIQHRSRKRSVRVTYFYLIFVLIAGQPKVRTKYDRMFERKNQNILSEHFTKLVDHATDSDSDDDFITLKRADHDLNDPELLEHDFASKRKLKMALSKKAIAKGGPKGRKLVFDEEGNPHELYEMKTAEEVFKGKDDVKEAGRKFAEDERGKLREADVLDREEAKEKKKEKKRKRKEREREVCDTLF